MRHLFIGRNKNIAKQFIERRISRADFKLAVQEFRSKYNISELNEKTKKEMCSDKYSKKNDQKRFIWEFDIFSKLHKLDLESEWIKIFFDYATTGKYNPNNDPTGIVISEEIIDAPKYFQKKFSLLMHPSITKIDLINAWPKINSFIRNGNKNRKPKTSKNFNRDIYIYKLKVEQNRSYKEISKIILNKFKVDLNEEYLRSIVSKEKQRVLKERTFYHKS